MLQRIKKIYMYRYIRIMYIVYTQSILILYIYLVWFRKFVLFIIYNRFNHDRYERSINNYYYNRKFL